MPDNDNSFGLVNVSQENRNMNTTNFPRTLPSNFGQAFRDNPDFRLMLADAAENGGVQQAEHFLATCSVDADATLLAGRLLLSLKLKLQNDLDRYMQFTNTDTGVNLYLFALYMHRMVEKMADTFVAEHVEKGND